MDWPSVGAGSVIVHNSVHTSLSAARRGYERIMSTSKPNPKRRTCAAILLTLAAWSTAVGAESVTVDVPIRLDATFLREAMVSQVFTEAGETARVWDDGSGCNHMVLGEPRVGARDGNVRLATRGEARVGTAIGNRCVLLLDWAGSLETSQSVSLEPGGAVVRFEVVDSALADGGTLGGTLWDLVKDHVHPRLGALRIDLAPALNELRAVLPFILSADPAAVTAILDSVALRAVSVVEDGLEAVLAFEVPLGPTSADAPRAPEPALTEAELARFTEATQSFDGFITFTVKYLAATSASVDINRDLLFVLIEARYDILRILSEDPAAVGPDPVRELFLRTWSRLSPILKRLGSTTPGQQGLNLLGFIAAADALRALDAVGPRLELELTADGLRRMARALAPGSTADPLEIQEGVDPGLRELFDFGPAPTLPPELPEAPAPDDGEAPAGEPLGWLQGRVLRTAHANTGPDPRLVDRLNRWVPQKSEIPDYLPLVRDLLHGTAARVVAESELDGGLHPMFRAMVLATAWQETCWRQFTIANGKVAPIKSGGGAVGMMQVLPSVWRGFYDGKGLARDIAYNAAAGSEILMHYLVDYAIARGEHENRGGVDNLPRAAYAAYNGGPGHLGRYRSSKTSDSLKRIDQAFWDKYRAIAGGEDLAVLSCFDTG